MDFELFNVSKHHCTLRCFVWPLTVLLALYAGAWLEHRLKSRRMTRHDTVSADK